MLASLATLPLIARAGPARRPAEADWILGTWRSDAELSMAHFTFQGQRPAPEMLPRISALFGKLSHTYTPTRMVVDHASENGSHREEWAYRVEHATSSTVSLWIDPPCGPSRFTLYRGDGHYFMRAGEHFEYYRKRA